MIVKTKLPWVRMLFTISGTSLRHSWSRILLATLISVVVTVVQLYWGLEAYTLTPAPFTIIGVAISIFMAFRNNTAYDRFWEGRILWGNLVNVSRSFARQVLTLVSLPSLAAANYVAEANEKAETNIRRFHRRLVYQTIAFVHALRHHLRDTDPTPDLHRFLMPRDMAYIQSQNNKPYAILQLMAKQIQRARTKKWVHPYHIPVLEDSLTTMTNILGACERIKNTPFPFTYTVLSHRIVAFFCFFLPFGIVETVGIFTPVVVFLVSHAFFGLDVIGEEIEDPFGTEPHHLPLAALCRTIEINLQQIIHDADVPKPLAPQGNVLL